MPAASNVQQARRVRDFKDRSPSLHLPHVSRETCSETAACFWISYLSAYCDLAEMGDLFEGQTVIAIAAGSR
jgi:hypothetical protein